MPERRISLSGTVGKSRGGPAAIARSQNSPPFWKQVLTQTARGMARVSGEIVKIGGKPSADDWPVSWEEDNPYRLRRGSWGSPQLLGGTY